MTLGEWTPDEAAGPLVLRRQAGGADATCRRILAALPHWFGLPDSVDRYVDLAARCLSVVASSGGSDIGITVVERHGRHAAEIAVMGVLPEWHRRGVGRAMLSCVEEALIQDSAPFLLVKTLSARRPDVGYAATRAFYFGCGFEVIEEMPDLWDATHPAVQLVKSLD